MRSAHGTHWKYYTYSFITAEWKSESAKGRDKQGRSVRIPGAKFLLFSPYEIRTHCPPGMSACVSIKSIASEVSPLKLRCPEFLLMFHCGGMTDWVISHVVELNFPVSLTSLLLESPYPLLTRWVFLYGLPPFWVTSVHTIQGRTKSPSLTHYWPGVVYAETSASPANPSLVNNMLISSAIPWAHHE